MTQEIDIEAADGVQALRLLQECRPDVLFLDIQMPGATGLDVARQVQGRSHVVFVTAYDQYAVSAFDEGAVDYLLKPLEPARLFTAIQRVKQRMAGPPADLSAVLSQLGAQAGKLPQRQFLRWINASVLSCGVHSAGEDSRARFDAASRCPRPAACARRSSSTTVRRSRMKRSIKLSTRWTSSLPTPARPSRRSRSTGCSGVRPSRPSSSERETRSN